MEKVVDSGLGIARVTVLSAVCLHVAHTECVCYDVRSSFFMCCERLNVSAFNPTRFTTSL